jgi:hypothetical protein
MIMIKSRRVRWVIFLFSEKIPAVYGLLFYSVESLPPIIDRLSPLVMIVPCSLASSRAPHPRSSICIRPPWAHYISEKQSPPCSGSVNKPIVNAGFLLALFFDTENGGDMVLRNVV